MVRARRSLILPLAGGKGGTGKTMMVANLSLALARRGLETVMVDLDLGASNLHTLIGEKNLRPGIGRLLVEKGLKLESLTCPTAWTNLAYIPGDNQVPRSANPHYAQKQKVIRGLKRLDFDVVLGDLGAGTTLTILDFYLLSPRGLIVYTAELPSLLNTYSFLRQALFRGLSQVLRDNHYATTVLSEFRAAPLGPDSWTMADLLTRMAEKAPGQEKRVEKVLKWFKPGLILSQVRSPEDLQALPRLINLARTKLSIEPVILGAVPHDEAAREAVLDRQPVYIGRPDSAYAQAVGRIAGRVPGWQSIGLDELRAEIGEPGSQAPDRAAGSEEKTRVLSELLPVVDDLVRALNAAREAAQEALAEGLRATLDNQLTRLARHGLEPIPAEGLPFDPNFHQAVGTEPATGQAKGVILNECSMGFTLNGKLFRPSQVIVAE